MPIPSCSKFNRGYKFNKAHISSHSKAADHKRHNFKGSKTVTFLVPVSVGSISIVIIYFLTKFEKRESLDSQRAWTMVWLAVGIASCTLTNAMTRTLVPNKLKSHSDWHFFWRYLGFLLGFGTFLVPTIGGFVTVGQIHGVWRLSSPRGLGCVFTCTFPMRRVAGRINMIGSAYLEGFHGNQSKTKDHGLDVLAEIVVCESSKAIIKGAA